MKGPYKPMREANLAHPHKEKNPFMVIKCPRKQEVKPIFKVERPPLRR